MGQSHFVFSQNEIGPQKSGIKKNKPSIFHHDWQEIPGDKQPVNIMFSTKMEYRTLRDRKLSETPKL